MTSIESVSTFVTTKNYESSNSDTDDVENIPYHAREYARPFTYGALPEGFSTSALNHVTFEEPGADNQSNKPSRSPAALPPSPTTQRKPIRPSVQTSRPILRKTPSRQEFEEMLLERREQALREQNNVALQMAQNAAIQKDLDELQEKLNKSGVLLNKNNSNCTALVRHVETIDLPNVEAASSDHERENVIRPIAFEPALLIADQSKRSETPSFPTVPTPPADGRCISPYPLTAPSTPPAQRLLSNAAHSQFSELNSESNNNIGFGKKLQPLPNAFIAEPHEVEPHLVKFAKDSSEYWYKPHITREESVGLLRHAAPGTFIIRNSTTYKNAYGLVLRVAKPPHGVVVQDASNNDELVRHFLIEPTTRGVRLKGCANEPTFTSLSALVYQHSITPLALPCPLIIPDRDLLHVSGDVELIAAQKQLLAQGAACNVLYLFTCDMESLTGDEAVRKAVHEMYSENPLPQPIEVHFKVSQQGITLTDNRRRLFFRRHYIANNISHIGIDPENRYWTVTANDEGLERAVKKTIFAFIARPLTGTRDNQCHVFCDLAITQPATAIISFAKKILPMDKHLHKML